MTRIDPERDYEIDLGLDEPDDEPHLRAALARQLRARPADLPPLEVRKRAIDARRGRVRFHLTVGAAGPARELGLPHPREVDAAPGRPHVVIVGDGPAGLFCAYQLARDGVACTVVDRGKQVQPRRHDLAALNKAGAVDPDSNYCFGEGGAGTYSDGKLYTRAHKRGDVRDVIEILALHGAPPAILTDARPHIGSNKLPVVIASMRTRLEAAGVALRFGARVVELAVDSGRAAGVVLQDGAVVAGDAVVLATGHSARDVFELLLRRGVPLEPKAFALGVRIEHPQPLIDQIQYGRAAGHARLPAAAYRLAHQADGRGVFSFCMCPGGWVVPAATEPGGLVVNGMSLSRRDSRFANSGIVVGVEPGDVAAATRVEERGGVLGGVALQRAIERAAFDAGGGALRAPATRLTDFLARRGSTTVPDSSYLPGLAAADVAEVVDAAGLALAARLREGLAAFGRTLRGFLTEEAVLIATESRTSAPVRVPRDPDTLESPALPRLYPTGEGAGYAGGIVSAAMDGVRVARAVRSALAR
ncbi:MAG TPA: FAD-binding protein [Kofleriaceae bacterium]|nr:FAD-binding protein [Kofleriaceae bacterium]